MKHLGVKVFTQLATVLSEVDNTRGKSLNIDEVKRRYVHTYRRGWVN